MIKINNVKEMVLDDFKSLGKTEILQRFIDEDYRMLTAFYHESTNYRRPNSRYDDLIYFELWKEYGRLGLGNVAETFVGFAQKDHHIYAVYDNPQMMLKMI